MKKYYVQNGKIVINKYAVNYHQSINNINSETQSDVIQYCRNENELNSLTEELSRGGIEYTISEIDTADILKFDGIAVSDDEEARKIIEPSIDEVKSEKIKELSDVCKQTIYNGIDIELNDGNVHHFSLKIEDQLNLNRLAFMCENYDDTESIIYHANGEEYHEFSKDEFLKIVKAASDFISLETMYYGKLKQYISNLSDIEEISGIMYGIEI